METSRATTFSRCMQDLTDSRFGFVTRFIAKPQLSNTTHQMGGSIQTKVTQDPKR